MNVTLVEITQNPEALIEKAARICYQSQKSDSQEGTRRFIAKLLASGHESVVEHASATFMISCSRACSHQIVRHRLASYSQKSQRYVTETDFNYIVPTSVTDDAARDVFRSTMNQCIAAYQTLMSLGVPKEDARYVLPNATETELIVSMNFRELRHFIGVRADKKAQWEIREIAKQMLMLVYEHAPSVFGDLY